MDHDSGQAGTCFHMHAQHKDCLPNQALQPTATAVMHPADAGCPPAAAVADL